MIWRRVWTKTLKCGAKSKMCQWRGHFNWSPLFSISICLKMRAESLDFCLTPLKCFSLASRFPALAKTSRSDTIRLRTYLTCKVNHKASTWKNISRKSRSFKELTTQAMLCPTHSNSTSRGRMSFMTSSLIFSPLPLTLVKVPISVEIFGDFMDSQGKLKIPIY
jgi:hypothetical protein